MTISLGEAANLCELGGGTMGTPPTATLTTTGTNWGTNNTNENIVVNGAGASGADLVTTTKTVVSTTNLTLNANNGTAVSSHKYVIGKGTLSSSNWTTKYTITLANAVVAGDLIVAFINSDPAVTVTVSDGTNSFLMTSSQTNADYYQVIGYLLAAPAASAGTYAITMTASGTPADTLTSFSILRFTSSLPGTWATAGFNKNSATNTAVTPGAVNPTGSQGVFVHGTGVDSNITATGGASGFTVTPTTNQYPNGAQSGLGDTFGDIVEYQIWTSPPGSTNPSATQSSNAIFVSMMQAFSFTPIIAPLDSFPDSLPHNTTAHPSQALFSARNIAPVAAVTVPTVAFWDYPARHQQPHRAALETSFFSPPPVVAARLSDAAPIGAKTSYPERIDRPARPPSDWGITRNIAPIAAAVTPTQFPTSYPEAVRGPQRAPSDWAPSGFAGSVDDAGVDWVYPDRIDPPRRPAPDAVTVVGAPERTQVYLDADFPDRVLRAQAVAQQQDAAAHPLAPERTSTYLDQDFPDRVLAARRPAPDAVTTVLAPEQTIARAPTSYPDTALRTRSAPDYATTAGQPEAPLPEPRTTYPDRIDRPRGTPDAVTEAGNPIPNTAAPVSAYVSYPDRIDRVGGLRTANQQDAAARNLPPLVVVRMWDLTSYPATVPAAPRTAQFLDATEINPLPRANSPAPTIGYWSYPDRVLRAPPVAQQQDAAAHPLAPEEKLPAPYTSYPDRALGTPFPVTEQQHVAALPTKPEDAVPLMFGSYPDRVLAAPAVAQQQAAAAIPFAPEVKAPSDWRTSYPDAVRGPLQPQQLASTGVGLPPVVPTFFGLPYPDIVRGRTFAAHQQQVYTAPVQPPPPPLVPVYFSAVYPERLVRISYWAALDSFIAQPFSITKAPEPSPRAPFISVSTLAIPVSTSVIVTYGSSSS